MTHSIPKSGAVILSLAAVATMAWGLYATMHSPLFLVQVVEVGDLTENAPVDAQTITDLAGVPIGKVNLFQVDLSAVEHRILSNPWVREVSLTKRFPQTLSIGITFREPRALIEQAGGRLSYVDTDGTVFGSVNLLTPSDLPILTGFAPALAKDRVSRAVSLIGEWDRSPVAPLSQLSSVGWDDEHGYRAAVYYAPTTARQPAAGAPLSARSRAIVHLGQDPTSDLPAFQHQLTRLAGVLGYLREHSIGASQIWADSGKKIVVRTSHGS